MQNASDEAERRRAAPSRDRLTSADPVRQEARPDAITALIAWAADMRMFAFSAAVGFLRTHGHDAASARATIRTLLDRRLLIAKTTLGQIDDETTVIHVGLRRRLTTEPDVLQTLGEPALRRPSASGGTECLWVLTEGTQALPAGRPMRRHSVRDRRLMAWFGRSHVPFGPLYLGERLTLRCRFGADGLLRSHRVEVV